MYGYDAGCCLWQSESDIWSALGGWKGVIDWLTEHLPRHTTPPHLSAGARLPFPLQQALASASKWCEHFFTRLWIHSHSKDETFSQISQIWPDVYRSCGHSTVSACDNIHCLHMTSPDADKASADKTPSAHSEGSPTVSSNCGVQGTQENRDGVGHALGCTHHGSIMHRVGHIKQRIGCDLCRWNRCPVDNEATPVTYTPPFISCRRRGVKIRPLLTFSHWRVCCVAWQLPCSCGKWYQPQTLQDCSQRCPVLWNCLATEWWYISTALSVLLFSLTTCKVNETRPKKCSIFKSDTYRLTVI